MFCDKNKTKQKKMEGRKKQKSKPPIYVGEWESFLNLT